MVGLTDHYDYGALIVGIVFLWGPLTLWVVEKVRKK